MKWTMVYDDSAVSPYRYHAELRTSLPPFPELLDLVRQAGVYCISLEGDTFVVHWSSQEPADHRFREIVDECQKTLRRVEEMWEAWQVFYKIHRSLYGDDDTGWRNAP